MLGDDFLLYMPFVHTGEISYYYGLRLTISRHSLKSSVLMNPRRSDGIYLG